MSCSGSGAGNGAAGLGRCLLPEACEAEAWSDRGAVGAWDELAWLVSIGVSVGRVKTGEVAGDDCSGFS